MNTKTSLSLTAQQLLLGLLCTTPIVTQAQVVRTPAATTQVQTAQPIARQLITIPLRFVPAHLMAWWLDPKSVPPAPEVLASQAAMMGTRPLAENIKRPLAPPQNTDWVWPDDGANQILVYGTPQWLAKIRETAGMLVRQPTITLGTRVVKINARGRQTLEFTAPNNHLPGEGYVFSQGPFFLEHIDLLSPQDGVTVAGSSERVLTNNLASSLLTASAPPPPEIVALAPQGIPTNAYNITATPTLNDDGTLTVVLNISKSDP